MARGSFELEAGRGPMKLNQRSGGATLRTLADVGRSDDFREQEADRVADHVLHHAEPTPVSSSQEDSSIRRKSETHDTGGSALAPSLGQGKPLDPADRRYFEPRFGLSLDHVRVHAEPQAAASAEAIHASAYTLGHDLVFGEGRYQPDTPAGRRLLAHELAHVAQQRQGAPSMIRRQPKAAEPTPTPPSRKDAENSEGNPDAGAANQPLKQHLLRWAKTNRTALCKTSTRKPEVTRYLSAGTSVEATHDAGNYYMVTVGEETGYVLKSDLSATEPKKEDTEKKTDSNKKDADQKAPETANPFQGIIDRATQTLTSDDGESFFLLDSSFGLHLLMYANDTKQSLPAGFAGDGAWGATTLKPLFRKAGWKAGNSWHALFTFRGRTMLATLRPHPGRMIGDKFEGPPVSDGLEAASLFPDWEKRLTAKKAMP